VVVGATRAKMSGGGARYCLVVGQKNDSSWSLRPWLLLRQSGLAFEEAEVGLFECGFNATLLAP
jgi:hypothetical protein